MSHSLLNPLLSGVQHLFSTKTCPILITNELCGASWNTLLQGGEKWRQDNNRPNLYSALEGEKYYKKNIQKV